MSFWTCVIHNSSWVRQKNRLFYRLVIMTTFVPEKNYFFSFQQKIKVVVRLFKTYSKPFPSIWSVRYSLDYSKLVISMWKTGSALVDHNNSKTTNCRSQRMIISSFFYNSTWDTSKTLHLIFRSCIIQHFSCWSNYIFCVFEECINIALLFFSFFFNMFIGYCTSNIPSQRHWQRVWLAMSIRTWVH